jgi:2-C-methyl-D-erythritol 4-phosphate cytidylyltransferase/2-C-methyl-D-erythritol 2,4-cyclodiphosphate synthase
VHVTAIIAAGGQGARFGAGQPKQWLTLRGRTLVQWALDAFLASASVTDVVVAVPAATLAQPPGYLHHPRVRLVAGGPSRQASVAAAFAVAREQASIVVVHDAARPLVSLELIARTIEAAGRDGAAIAAIGIHDTVKRSAGDGWIARTVPRAGLFIAQTPQAFRVEVLSAALVAAGQSAATDEAMLVEDSGHRVRLIEGNARNIKITTIEDMRMAESYLSGGGDVRVGHGYDLHRLVPDRPLVLAGLRIPFEKGLAGHSDADAVCHAVTDALLGASGLGDIGRHFPDTDPAWKDADSLVLLTRVVELVTAAGYSVGNVDVTVLAERPKLAPHADAMRASLARVLGVDMSSVSVKSKTNEGVDAVGAGDAIAVHAVALVRG